MTALDTSFPFQSLRKTISAFAFLIFGSNLIKLILSLITPNIFSSQFFGNFIPLNIKSPF